MRRLLAVGGACVAGVLASCAGVAPTPAPTSTPDTPAYLIQVTNVDGPPVRVINGTTVVARIKCADGGQLRQGADGLGPLPWHLRVETSDGTPLKEFDVAGGQDQVLLIRADAVYLGQFAGDGPAASPDACARWQSLPNP